MYRIQTSEIKQCTFLFVFIVSEIVPRWLVAWYSPHSLSSRSLRMHFAHPETRLERRGSSASNQPARYQMFQRRMMQFRSRILYCFGPEVPCPGETKTKRRFITVAFNIWGWRTDAVTLRAVPSVGSVIRFSQTARIAPSCTIEHTRAMMKAPARIDVAMRTVPKGHISNDGYKL